MKPQTTLPRHLYLVRTPARTDLHKPSPDTMGGKGYNLQRMAEVFDVENATIGTRLTRARQALRDRLDTSDVEQMFTD